MGKVGESPDRRQHGGAKIHIMGDTDIPSAGCYAVFADAFEGDLSSVHTKNIAAFIAIGQRVEFLQEPRISIAGKGELGDCTISMFIVFVPVRRDGHTLDSCAGVAEGNGIPIAVQFWAAVKRNPPWGNCDRSGSRLSSGSMEAADA